MARQQIVVKGITTNSAYEDGDTYSLVNLRAKNNSLQPVTPRGSDGKICGNYDILYTHANMDYEHLVGVNKFIEKNSSGVEENYFSAYWNIKADAEGVCPERTVIVEHAKGTLTGIQSTGNLLIFVCKETIYYALWKNKDYLWIGELPELLPIEFNCYEEKVIEETLGLDVTQVYTGEWSETKDKIKTIFVEMMAILQTGSAPSTLTDYEVRFMGWLTNARLVRYAYRLYDGTTIKASNPILLMPGSSLMSLYKIKNLSVKHWKSHDNWIDLSISEVVDAPELHGTYSLTGYSPGIRYDFSSLQKYEDIILSVDVFMSPPLFELLESEDDNWNTTVKGILGYSSMRDGGSVMFREDQYGDQNMVAKLGTTEKDSFASMESFYKILEIKPGKKSVNTDATKNNFVKLFDNEETYVKVRNLLYQEKLDVDTFSHNTVGADVSYMYNDRLHLSGIHTTMYSGFDYRYFRWENEDWEDYYDYNGTLYGDGGTVYFKYLTDAGRVKRALINNHFKTLVIETTLNISNEKYLVYSEFEITDETVFGFMSGYLSYPDERAIKMTFYAKTDRGAWEDGSWISFGSVDLKPHNFLNIAYYINWQNDDIMPIYTGWGHNEYNKYAIGKTQYVPEPSAYKEWKENGVTIIEDNKIKVSDTSNPFYFPNENVNVVGTSKILALATNRQNVSDRNYGMYPLYVFAEDGVYTMAVGDGDIPYKTISQPVFGEAPSNKVICSTPYGVLFISKRGLFMINGNKVTYLSAKLDEEPRHLNIEDSPHITDVIIHNHPLWIRTFLQDADAMFYNPFENEVIMRNPSQKFHWVIDLDGGLFYQSTQTANKVVENVISGLLVIGDEDPEGHFPILDYGKDSDELASVSMVIRPLSYGTPDVKKLERMILRGLMTTDTSEIDGAEMFPIVMLHYSDDQVNMKAAAGHQLKIGNRRDIDAGLRGRLKHRWFMTIFAGAVTRDSRIFYLDSEITKEYNNTKMR